MRTACGIVCWLAAVLPAGLSAQTLRVEGPPPERVALGREVEVLLLVDGAGGAVVPGALPALEGLEVALVSSAPAAGSGSARLRLRPLRPGTFEIPPLSVVAGGRTLRTKPWRLEALDDEEAARRARLEISAPSRPVRVGERVRLRLRFLLDARVRARELLSMFRRDLDLPVHLEVPWFGSLEGTRDWSFEEPAPGEDAVSFAFNGERRAAALVEGRLPDGRAATGLEVALAFTVDGDVEVLRVPGALAGFRFATRFREDLLRGRVPLDAREGFVWCEGTEMPVLPLPEEGRPEGFAGAVGNFRLEATFRPADPAAPGELDLLVRVEGTGDLSSLEPPTLPGLSGYEVTALTQEPAEDHVVFRYRLKPTGAGPRRVPAATLVFFDPGPPARYRVARAGMSDEVGGGEARELDAVADLPGLLPLEPDRRSLLHRRPSLLLVFLILALPHACAAGAFLWLRRRRMWGDPAFHARRAARRLRASLAAGQEPGAAFCSYLAARLHCEEAAVITPELPRMLERRGIAPALAGEAGALAEDLVGARYGGPGLADAQASVLRMAAALEAAFRGSGRGLALPPLILVALAFVQPGPLPDAARAAARAYREGRFRDALALYEEAGRSGDLDPAVLAYDLGTCWYRLGEEARALAFYERALGLRPGDASMRRARDRARAALGLEPLRPGLLDHFTSTELLLIASAWQALAWMLVFLVLGVARRRRLLLALVLLLLLAGWWPAARAVHRDWLAPPSVMVVEDDVALLPDPHPSLVPLATLPPGSTLRLLESSDRWLHVRTPSTAGWIPRPAALFLD